MKTHRRARPAMWRVNNRCHLSQRVVRTRAISHLSQRVVRTRANITVVRQMLAADCKNIFIY